MTGAALPELLPDVLSDRARGRAPGALGCMEMVILHSCLFPPPPAGLPWKLNRATALEVQLQVTPVSKAKALQTGREKRQKQEEEKKKREKNHNKKRLILAATKPEHPRKSLHNLALQDK